MIDTESVTEQFTDKIVERIKQGYPEDITFLQHYKKNYTSTPGYNPSSEKYLREEKIKLLAKYKARHEQDLKQLKAEFKTMYKNTDPSLSINKREEETKKLFLAKYPNLQKEVTKDIGLNFRPADTAIILAAKECFLDPFTKTGKISSHIRNLLTQAAKLNEKAQAEYEKAMETRNRLLKAIDPNHPPLTEEQEKVFKMVYLGTDF